MTQEILKKFIITEVYPKMKHKLLEFDQILEDQNAGFRKQICSDFIDICTKVIKDPGYYERRKTAYIAFHFLRTRMLTRDFRYQIRFYDADWSMNDGLLAGDIDFGLYYRPYAMIWDELLADIRNYGGKIKEYHVEMIMQALIKKFNSHVTDALRKGCYKVIESDEYSKLSREERVLFYTGEILNKPEMLFIDNRMRTDMFEVRERIEEKESLAFEDLRRKRFEKEDFGGIDFEYTDFGYTELIDTDFSGAYLKGTRFHDAAISQCRFLFSVLDDIDLENCSLSHVNFSGAVIKNTDFTKARMDSCQMENAAFYNCRIPELDGGKCI